MFSRMINMKKSVAEKLDSDAVACAPMSGEDYPWGLSISLGNDELEKLDLDGDCTAGDTIDLRAFAKVTSVSVREINGRQERRIELQITDLAVESEEEEVRDEETSEPRGRYK